MMLLCLLGLLQDPATLVERLGDDAIDVREAAEERLAGLGTQALAALEDAVRDPDVDRRTRVADLIERIRRIEREGPIDAVNRTAALAGIRGQIDGAEFGFTLKRHKGGVRLETK